MRRCTWFGVDGERLGWGERAIRWAGLPTWTTHKVQHITQHVNCGQDRMNLSGDVVPHEHRHSDMGDASTQYQVNLPRGTKHVHNVQVWNYR